MSTELTPAQEKLYAEAEQLSGYNALSLRAMALKAYERRRDKEAMQVYSFVWNRNARTLARAVELFEDEFEEAGVWGTDDYLSMFAIASTGKFDAPILFKEWRDKSLDYWQIRERVAELKQRKPHEKKKQTVVCPHCAKSFEL